MTKSPIIIAGSADCLASESAAVCRKKSLKAASVAKPEPDYETADGVVNYHSIMTPSVPYEMNKCQTNSTSASACHFTDAPNEDTHIGPNRANTGYQDPDPIYSYITASCAYDTKTSAPKRELVKVQIGTTIHAAIV